MPNISSYVKVAETVSGCLQEARAEVRNAMQSRAYLHVQQRKGWDHQVSQDKLIHSSPQNTEEAGSRFGPWPVFSASLAFCLPLVAFIVLVRKPRFSSHPFLWYLGASYAIHSAYITEGDTGKFLPSLSPSFGYFHWCSKYNVRFDVSISRSWHGICCRLLFYLYVSPQWLGAHSMNQKLVLCNTANEMRISSQYVFSHCAPPASSGIMTGISKFSHYPHSVSS